MLDVTGHLARSSELQSKLIRIFQKRVNIARDHFTERVRSAFQKNLTELVSNPMSVWDLWTGYYGYAMDWAQRSILFWDTMRERGNLYLKHERAGKPPVLHFDYEIVLDARK